MIVKSILLSSSAFKDASTIDVYDVMNARRLDYRAHPRGERPRKIGVQPMKSRHVSSCYGTQKTGLFRYYSAQSLKNVLNKIYNPIGTITALIRELKPLDVYCRLAPNSRFRAVRYLLTAKGVGPDPIYSFFHLTDHIRLH